MVSPLSVFYKYSTADGKQTIKISVHFEFLAKNVELCRFICEIYEILGKWCFFREKKLMIILR